MRLLRFAIAAFAKYVSHVKDLNNVSSQGSVLRPIDIAVFFVIKNNIIDLNSKSTVQVSQLHIGSLIIPAPEINIIIKLFFSFQL